MKNEGLEIIGQIMKELMNGEREVSRSIDTEKVRDLNIELMEHHAGLLTGEEKARAEATINHLKGRTAYFGGV